ncbi:MAG: hypothetical protein ACRD1H_01200 [Vicinamibacterales bacterium]
MSSEIHGLSDLHQQIMQALMDGWQTMDASNRTGMFRLHDLADRFGLPVEEMRKEMALLETLGYVDNVHSMGMDQSQAYTGVEQTAFIEHDPVNPTYFISENGKRRVLADLASDTGDAASP